MHISLTFSFFLSFLFKQIPAPNLLVKVLDDAGLGRALVLVLQPQRHNLGANALVAQVTDNALDCLL